MSAQAERIPHLSISWILYLRYMKVEGVPTGSRIDYVTLHLLEGEARTWYDLRVNSVQNETFETFSTALKEHFTNHNSQRHYRKSL